MTLIYFLFKFLSHVFNMWQLVGLESLVPKYIWFNTYYNGVDHHQKKFFFAISFLQCSFIYTLNTHIYEYYSICLFRLFLHPSFSYFLYDQNGGTRILPLIIGGALVDHLVHQFKSSNLSFIIHLFRPLVVRGG